MLKPSKRHASIGIIGGGAAGLVTALTLQEAGFPVHVYERHKDFSQNRCSWLAGGMIAPWCERDASERAVIERGKEALQWWPEHYKETRCRGSLVLSSQHDRHEIVRFARRSEAFDYLEGEDLAALEPALEGRFQEGLFFPQEAHLDPRKALLSLAWLLEQQGGLLSFGQEVSPRDIAEDIVIDCRGWAAHPEMPRLRGVRGEMIRVRSYELNFSRPVRLLHPRFPVYIVPRGEGIFMVGATSIENAYDGPVSVQSAYTLLEALQRLHPAFGEAEIIELNTGIRPAFPDNLPDVEQHGRLFRANGLYRHGFLLSPWCARQVKEQVMAYCGEMA
ncbi:FAD-dependent oxidoreductase [Saccharibacter sp. 17.LH.SD]|uniref:FAD-dependent oxidoreductase n=1 Tax=Saccharibacter sp. 17.LH.SD TaxID=2689393 RepID=UPI001371FF7A|nr:FAD-dependent oxidoreductase [Saccharibacter sp. 17.LH.SD]MXV44464.1 FAD-dependent oxidoreductase [Saccharibacter sp. 17.LH.SD]